MQAPGAAGRDANIANLKEDAVSSVHLFTLLAVSAISIVVSVVGLLTGPFSLPLSVMAILGVGGTILYFVARKSEAA
ncbi:hypothetical protein DF042_27025 [Burkholderia cenocepacia]|nr:hypothetical protein DF042_27025 [Burkholderia cenocepacia]